MDGSVAQNNDDSKKDTEDETVSISEIISLGDVSEASTSDESGKNLLFVGVPTSSQSLEVPDDSNKNDTNRSNSFMDDMHLDNLLSPSNIAQHFLGDNNSDQSDTFESKSSLNKSHQELESVEVLADAETSTGSPSKYKKDISDSTPAATTHTKEDSPIGDDTIFINDNKIKLSLLQSLNSDDQKLSNVRFRKNRKISNESRDKSGILQKSFDDSSHSLFGSVDEQRKSKSLDCSLEKSTEKSNVSENFNSSMKSPINIFKNPENKIMLEDPPKSIESIDSLHSEKDKSDEEMIMFSSEVIGMESIKMSIPDVSESSDENKIIAITCSTAKNTTKPNTVLNSEESNQYAYGADSSNQLNTKHMLRTEDIEKLEAISEESERVLACSKNSESTLNQASLKKDTENEEELNVNDNSMISILENKVRELQEIIVSKDICLAALNMQISSSRRESLNNGRDSLKDMNGSGRESTSLITMSTEYRTIQDEYMGKMLDIQSEITERDDLIEQLTESLQQSMNVRVQLQEHTDKLTTEILQLRKQLSSTKTISKTSPDREIEDWMTNSDLNMQTPQELPDMIKKFKSVLTDQEQQHFNAIDNKISQFLSNEHKEFHKKIENVEKENSILLQQKQELEEKHSQEMEDLRKYFEKKCVDMEKHYSVEVFSQESRRLSNDDSNSDLSDQDNILDEQNNSFHSNSSPKRKTKTLFLSPTHRKLTPTDIDICTKEDTIVLTSDDFNANLEFNFTPSNAEPTVKEIKQFYSARLKKINDIYNTRFMKMKENLDRLANHPKDDNIVSNKNEEGTVIVINEQHDFNLIVAEYDRRLNEQVALAKKDVLDELEIQIQALLSTDTATEDDNNWPRELILLREKFTAKSQLEINQIQIKHDEEMARMKADFEKQFQRKLKRHTTFDLSRDLDKIINERDSLRDLSATLRSVLNEFAKYFTIYDDDLNSTVTDDANKNSFSGDDVENMFDKTMELDVSATSNISERRKQMKSIWDVTNLLSIIEDPSLIEYISKNSKENGVSPAESEASEQLDIQVCLERLKSEAFSLLKLSEKFAKINFEKVDEKVSPKNESVKEEDRLNWSSVKTKLDFLTTKSFDESMLHETRHVNNSNCNNYQSLPTTIENKSELNIQLHELRNRLLKSEDERRNLEIELADAISRNDSVVQEMSEAKQDLHNYKLLSIGKEVFSEGYGTNHTKIGSTPSFIELQEKAKSMLSANASNGNISVDNTALLQLVEDFCRESDRYMDDGRREKDDLQMQIDAADKQLKATRQFLEDQAIEREQERDDFTKEIEKLKVQMKEKDKEKTNYDRFNKEEIISENSCPHCVQLKTDIETLEAQLKETANHKLEFEDKKQKLENDLKASIDKIFVLREIISELETQNESKTLNEHVLNEKIKELEQYIHSQNKTNESLHMEVESLRTEVDNCGYNEKITSLEEQLKLSNSNTEQNAILEQLKEIDATVVRKVKILETLYATSGSLSCSSLCEDVSTKNDSPLHKLTKKPSPLCHELSKIIEKLKKHTVLEEATIKRLTDIEMQFTDLRNVYTELEHERDILQERMSEQLSRISSLQSRLDEQRLRAEDLYRQGTSDLSIKVHDLNNDVSSLKETLSTREKQINNLKSQLEQSKTVIDRQEVELSAMTPEERVIIDKLELELQLKCEELAVLKDKIKNEMINKVTLPDLMETVLADKNDEIDQLREKLRAKEHELEMYIKENISEEEQKNHSKESGRTLSDIVSISEFDEPDVMRKMTMNVQENELQGVSSDGLPLPPVLDKTSKLFEDFSFDQMKSGNNKQLSTLFGKSNTNENIFGDSSLNKNKVSILTSISPEIIPRQINFSNLENSIEQYQNSKSEKSSLHQHQILEEDDAVLVPEMKAEIESLKLNLDKITSEKNQINMKLNERANEVSKLQVELAAKNKLYTDILAEKKQFQQQLDEVKINLIKLDNLETVLKEKDTEMCKILEQLKKLENDINTKNYDFETLNKNHANLLNDYNALSNDLEKVKMENATANLSSSETFKNQMNALTQQIESLKKTISHKDELISNLVSDVETLKQLDNKEIIVRLEKELDESKQDLNEKMIDFEKLKLELNAKESEIENLRSIINRNDMNASPKLFSVDELAEQVEKELNYSAQLDSNILRAIESDDLNSEDDIPKISDKHNALANNNRSNYNDAEQMEWKQKYDAENENCKRLQMMIEAEKKKSNSIQIQDANIIEAIRHRLETALENENVLQKLLEEERMKTLHLTGVQKTKSFDNYLLLKSGGGDFSPIRKYHNRSQSDLESESIKRKDTEMKLMTSQMERDKERIMDLQRVLERERNRFEKEITDRNAYGDDLKKEINRLIKEKENIEIELDHSQERLILAQEEIKSLETRLALLPDNEIRRNSQQDRHNFLLNDSAELCEIKLQCANLEKERNELINTINMMRLDIDRNSQPPSQSLMREFAGNEQVPEQFIIKLKEMNNLLAMNTKENHRMAETLKLLTDERRVLQNRITELLESKQRNNYYSGEELEERSNHLFGKYLRVESHRKALVHQKRYLLIILAAYEKNEDKILAMLNGNDEAIIPKYKKKASFKAVVIAVIAISRMKYIVNRWQTGRIVAARAIFSAQFNPRRSHSAFLPTFPISPPVRERTRRAMLSDFTRPLDPTNNISGIRENLRYE